MEANGLREWVMARLGRIALAGAVVVVLLCAIVRWAGDADHHQAGQVAPVRAATPVSLAKPIVPPENPVVASESASTQAEVQVCGGAWLKAGPDGHADADEVAALMTSEARTTKTSVLAAMQASRDGRAQAAAHFFETRGALVAAVAASSPASSVLPEAFASEDIDAHRNALARLAVASTDPQVYAWAYSACHPGGVASAGACQLISGEQWARLDPENAAPWLILAGAAAKRGDVSSRDDAMYHVANAERLDSGFGRLTGELVRFAPAGDAHLVGEFGLATEALGFEAATPFDYGTALDYCRSEALVDANRRETCGQVGELFASRSTTFLERAIAVGFGRRLGWPQDRIEGLREQEKAAAAMAPRPDPAVDGDDCGALRRGLRYFGEMAKEGEVTVLQRALAAQTSAGKRAAGSAQMTGDGSMGRISTGFPFAVPPAPGTSTLAAAFNPCCAAPPPVR